MTDYEDLSSEIDDIGEGKFSNYKGVSRANSGELISSANVENGLMLSKEKRKAQQRAEKKHYDAELQKLQQSLDHEVAVNKTYFEQSTKNECAKLEHKFQEKIDRIHLSQQKGKIEATKSAVEKTNFEIVGIESGTLRPDLQKRLIEQLYNQLDVTLDSIASKKS